MNREPMPDEEVRFVHRLLGGLVGTVCSCPRSVLTVSLLLAAVSAFFFNTRLEYHTKRNDLISADKDYLRRWQAYEAEFGSDEDMVVVVQGKDRARMRQALEDVAERVHQHPDLFDRLFYKVDLRALQNRALLYLPLDQVQRIQANIRSMSLLLELGPLSWRGLSLGGLLSEAHERAARLQTGAPLWPGDDQFFTQLLNISRVAGQTLDDPKAYRNPWHSVLPDAPQQENLMAEPQYFFSGDGTLAFLLTRPVEEKHSFTGAKQSVDQLRAILHDLGKEYTDLEFGLTGLPVLENDEMAAAQRDTHLASWLAIGGVTLLFFLVYRGIAYPLLTVMTLLVGTAWAMGWLTWTVGHLNILSATFAVMLIGMGDYGVLWVMRYEHARKSGMEVRAALLHTTRYVAIGNLTAATTLALAFFVAMFADFKAVAELGWIAGCGVLLCALACFTVLPATLVIFDRRPLAPVIMSLEVERGWLPRLTSRPGWICIAGLVLTVLLGACASRLHYDHNLLHLQARDLDAVKWEMILIEKTAGASWHAISYRPTAEEALALKARYEQLPEVSRVVDIATLVPTQQPEKIEILKDLHYRLRHLPARGQVIGHVRPSLKDLRAEAARVLARLEPLTGPDSEKLLCDLKASLTAFQERLDRAASPDKAEMVLQQFEERMAGALAEDLHRLREVCMPAPIALEELPADFRERYIGKNGAWLLRIFAKDCLWDFEPLEQFTRKIQSIDSEATGKPFTTVEGLKVMKEGFQRAGFYALLVITTVLMCDFRSLRNTLIGLTPLALGILLSMGIMALCGEPLNPANMIAFPLILGVGVDNGVHILHDHILRRRSGQATISYPIGRGVLVKAMTTMIGFGTLMIASERGLASLGFILALGVCCCMVSALVFLPAMLRWMDTGEEAKRTEPRRIRAAA